jgi:hypothetical protein
MIKIIFYNNNNIDVGLQDKILSNEINVDIINHLDAKIY